MSARLRLALALAAAAALATPARAADPTPAPRDLAAVKAAGTLRVAADTSAGAPYFSAGAAGPVGFEADMALALARKLGVKTAFVQVPWRQLRASVSDGRADVALNALEIKDDKATRFSKPYYVASQAILVRTGQAGIYDLADLAGKRVGATRGSVAAAILGSLKPPAIAVLGDDVQAPFQGLVKKQSDAVLAEAAMARTWLKKDAKAFKLVGRPVLPRPYGVAVRRGSPQLLAAIDEALASLRRTGEHAKILQAYGLWDSLQPEGGKPAAAASASPAPAAPHRRRRWHGRHP